MSLIDRQELIRVGGAVIRISDLRGFFIENTQRMILLKNGMKLTVTEAERETIQRQLSTEVKRIGLADRGGANVK